MDDVEDVLAEACSHAGGLITRAVLMCIDQILTGVAGQEREYLENRESLPLIIMSLDEIRVYFVVARFNIRCSVDEFLMRDCTNQFDRLDS